jgi:hemolysin (HlyC) family protein
MDQYESNKPGGHKPGLLERLSTLLLREPEDREQLIELLHSAYERNLLDADALSMMEGVIQVSERQVREIMIPRAQMDVIDISQPPEQFIPFVIETAHSRFPVIDGDKDNIIGILLAKDLLRYYAGEKKFDVRDMLRPAVFVPESKRLNVLLREFRGNRNHMALVVDEYGGVCGMVTIEDVLEQIVGEIEDEYDFDEDEDNLIPDGKGNWRVKAATEIEDFNETLGTDFSDEECDTIGGLVLKAAGELPRRGDRIAIGDFTFTVLRADSRRLYSLLAEHKPLRQERESGS